MASVALKSWRLQIFPKVFDSPTAASLKEIDDLTQEPVLPDEDPVALPSPCRAGGGRKRAGERRKIREAKG